MVDGKHGKRRKGTRTSKFGVSERVGHDSSEFYSKRLYTEGDGFIGNSGRYTDAMERMVDREYGPVVDEAENGGEVEYEEVEMSHTDISAGPAWADVVARCDCRKVPLSDESVHLMVTSPVYNVGKESDEDLDVGEYASLLRGMMKETFRILVPGGRACVNIANVGRKPYIPFHALVILHALEVGFVMRGEIIWDKEAGAGTSCAWGSWMSASDPHLRDTHEYILVFQKLPYKRDKGKKDTPGRREDSITRDDFLECTKSVWRFRPESARRIGHPSPFPVELPRRLIEMYSFVGDVVYDPMAGSGTTAVAAAEVGRHFVIFDINEEYVRLATTRLQKRFGYRRSELLPKCQKSRDS